MADDGAAVFIWQHYILVPVFIGDLLCAHAGRIWFFENANRHSLCYFWVYVARWLYPGWVVSGSHIITQINVCRLDDHIGRRVCFFDVTVLRDLYLFVRLLGIGNGLCVLVSVNQSNSRLGVEE